MSEFGQYLSRLRASLALPDRRAEEVCGEVYSHLVEHAAQRMESGMSREEARREAERVLGDPATVAAGITAVDQRYRPCSVFVTCVLLAAMFATASSVFDFCSGPACAGLGEWTARYSGLSHTGSMLLVMGMLLVPAAVLAGAAGGMRLWWIAAAPPFTWGLCVWCEALVSPSTRWAASAQVLVLPFLVAAALGSCAYLGGQIAALRGLRAHLVGGDGRPLVGLGLLALWVISGRAALWNQATPPVAAFVAVALGQAGVTALLFIARREGHFGGRTVSQHLRAVAAASGALLLLATMAQVAYYTLPMSSPARSWGWAAIVLTLLVIALSCRPGWVTRRRPTGQPM